MSELFQGQGTFFIRICLACICGGVIGIERQQRTKGAGIRTHIMISLATALMMIISKYGFIDLAGSNGLTCDVSRVAAGIITGVGILGGGLIFTGKQGNVSGITTTAGVWATIGIGMALGAGMYVLGIGTTLIVEAIQLILHKNLWITQQPTKVHVTFHVENGHEFYGQLVKKMNEHKFSMYQLKWEKKSPSHLTLRCQVVIPSQYDREEIVDLFTNIPQMETFEIIS